jgi:hypothetical protein
MRPYPVAGYVKAPGSRRRASPGSPGDHRRAPGAADGRPGFAPSSRARRDTAEARAVAAARGRRARLRRRGRGGVVVAGGAWRRPTIRVITVLHPSDEPRGAGPGCRRRRPRPAGESLSAWPAARRKGAASSPGSAPRQAACWSGRTSTAGASQRAAGTGARAAPRRVPRRPRPPRDRPGQCGGVRGQQDGLLGLQRPCGRRPGLLAGRAGRVGVMVLALVVLARGRSRSGSRRDSATTASTGRQSGCRARVFTARSLLTKSTGGCP